MDYLPGFDIGGGKLEVGSWKSEVGVGSWEAGAVIKTLAYAAVFNYPLRKDEIVKYLIKESRIKNQESRKTSLLVAHPHAVEAGGSLLTSLRSLQKHGFVCKKSSYYFLPGYESSVEQRLKREKIAQKKFAIAEKFCEAAKYIPTVRMIGISGALAMNNVHEDDDIDLFVIAKAGTVWTTRLFMVLLAEAMGIRRRPETPATLPLARQAGAIIRGNPSFKDKLCLNMFVDEKHMSVPDNERDLFSAHEVVQMKPIYNSMETYERFLWENRWVGEYLPNSIESNLKSQISNFKTTTKNSKLSNHITHYSLPITSTVESIAKRLQLTYMKGRQTNEVLQTGYLRFHPIDARRIILRRYKQILQSYTLDKVDIV